MRGVDTSARFIWTCDFAATPELVNAEMRKLADVIREFAESESTYLLGFDLEPLTTTDVLRFIESLPEITDEEETE